MTQAATNEEQQLAELKQIIAALPRETQETVYRIRLAIVSMCDSHGGLGTLALALCAAEVAATPGGV